DCDTTSLSPAIFPSIKERLLAFAGALRTDWSMLYTRSALVDEAARRGLTQGVEAIDALLEAEDLPLSAAAHITSGRVGVTAALLAKSNQLVLGGLLDANNVEDDPLRTAALIGIALGLDENRNLASRGAT